MEEGNELSSMDVVGEEEEEVKVTSSNGLEMMTSVMDLEQLLLENTENNNSEVKIQRALNELVVNFNSLGWSEEDVLKLETFCIGLIEGKDKKKSSSSS